MSGMPAKLLLCWQRNKYWGNHCWVEYLPCSPVLGYLAARILIEPFGLSIIHNVHGTKEIAEFGVVFLLFNIGLELSVERLSSMKKYVFGLGSTQVLVTAVVAGILARFIARQPCPAALIMGNGLALSSTVAVLQRSNSLATIEGYSGYGAEQGEKLLRATIASTFYANLGIEEDDVFILDGAKSDISRLRVCLGFSCPFRL